jgi:hypothetical protein
MDRTTTELARAAVLALTVVGLGACSSSGITITSAPNASFDAFRTFQIIPSQSIQEVPLRDAIEMLVATALEGKGMEEVTTGADLVVTCDGWIGSREQMATRLGYAVETWQGETTVYTVSRGVEVGVLVITVIDRSDGSIAWQSEARKGLDRAADPDTRLRRLEALINTMLSHYPSRR